MFIKVTEQDNDFMIAGIFLQNENIYFEQSRCLSGETEWELPTCSLRNVSPIFLYAVRSLPRCNVIEVGQTMSVVAKMNVPGLGFHTKHTVVNHYLRSCNALNRNNDIFRPISLYGMGSISLQLTLLKLKWRPCITGIKSRHWISDTNYTADSLLWIDTWICKPDKTIWCLHIHREKPPPRFLDI